MQTPDGPTPLRTPSPKVLVGALNPDALAQKRLAEAGRTPPVAPSVASAVVAAALKIAHPNMHCELAFDVKCERTRGTRRKLAAISLTAITNFPD